MMLHTWIGYLVGVQSAARGCGRHQNHSKAAFKGGNPRGKRRCVYRQVSCGRGGGGGGERGRGGGGGDTL